MKEFLESSKTIDYTHYVMYNGIEYVRSESLFLECYESELNKKLESHTIECHIMDDVEETTLECFSDDMGWSKNGKLRKSNPIPEIEKIFKETIGKDLI